MDFFAGTIVISVVVSCAFCLSQLTTKAPCTLSQSQLGICTLPGSEYPWHEIQKVIEGDQGNVRRIFGNVKDIVTFGAETDGNASAKYRMRDMTRIGAARNPCPSDMSLEQPFWSTNQKGQLRVIVNQSPFEQFVQIEKCLSGKQTSEQTRKCPGDECRCVQEYRLLRLVAYDPSEREHGIFMDWFKIPSCCQCKCVIANEEQSTGNSTDFLYQEREL